MTPVRSPRDSGLRPRVGLPASPSSTAPERNAGRPVWRRWLRWGAAVVFGVLGVLGLFLPFLQGILFLVIAVALAAPDLPVARRLLVAALRRWPKVRRRLPGSVRRLSRPDRDEEGP